MVVLILVTTTVVSTRYSLLNKFLKEEVFKKINQMHYMKCLQQLEGYLKDLHVSVVTLNKITGKIMLVLLILAFVAVITVVDVAILIFKAPVVNASDVNQVAGGLADSIMLVWFTFWNDEAYKVDKTSFIFFVVFWILGWNQILGIVILIWTTTAVVSTRYNLLNTILKEQVFGKSNQMLSKQFVNQFEGYLKDLHQSVATFNKITGKIMLALLILAFAGVITFFDLAILIFNKSGLVDSTLVDEVAGGLVESIILVVSGIVILIWATTNVLSTKYSLLNRSLKKVLYERSNLNLQNFEGHLRDLHMAAAAFNNIIGKNMMALLSLAFMGAITFLDFSVVLVSSSSLNSSNIGGIAEGPRHKAQTFDMTLWGKPIKTESLRKFNNFYKEYETLHPVNKSLESPRNKKKVSEYDKDEDLIDFEKLYECSSTSSGSCHQGLVIDELEEYLSKPRAANSKDFLEWWRTHETEYPTLSKMARDFLLIPATSVPAERLFSKASLVIRKHRNRLSDESARWLLCINSWSKE
ncbi:unnamed protein product [Diabrotica balteata]|uniref:HAT C-terminal dimerisation domain-containing protein n=1 Tax=Diabrotica balteata TaxID=107213 RepID=A0A9N9XEW2_DIABA|nr:unnamed protein product [Diabrotica balteata]